MLIKSIAATAALGLLSTTAFAADAPRTSAPEVAAPKTEVTKPKTEVTRPKGSENVRIGAGAEVTSAARGR